MSKLKAEMCSHDLSFTSGEVRDLRVHCYVYKLMYTFFKEHLYYQSHRGDDHALVLLGLFIYHFVGSKQTGTQFQRLSKR